MSRHREATNGPRWSLVLEVGSVSRVFEVAAARDADEVMTAVRSAIRDAMAKGGCRSLVLAVHVSGGDCDHELKGTG